MKKRNKKFSKKSQIGINKLKLKKKNDNRFSKKCPFKIKNAPKIDYKNIKILKKYITENGKILSSKISSISQGKQRLLTREIKKAKILCLI